MGTFGDFGEDEFDIGTILCRDFVKSNFVFLGVFESLLLGDLPLFLEVGLVAYKHDHDFALAELFYIGSGVLICLYQ